MKVTLLKRMGLMMLSLTLLLLMAQPKTQAAQQGESIAKPSSKTTHQYGADETLQKAFVSAAKEFHVPVNVLMAVAYNETRWEHHDGKPSTSGGYGIMHLTDADRVLTVTAKGEIQMQTASLDPSLHTLNHAAKLLGLPSDRLKHDPVQNIRGGAALLAQYAKASIGDLPKDPADWYGAVVQYSGSKDEAIAKGFADRVFATMQSGKERITSNGQHVVLKSLAVTPNKKTASHLKLRQHKKSDVDCPNGLSCEFIPALYEQFSDSPTDYGNYDLANRPYDGQDIRYIIIHDIEGTYEEGVNTFLSQSYVSAHYVVRETDGHIAEMVKPKDIAWQAGNWYINAHSIGIEHGGTAVDGAAWFSEPMYHASAQLVKYLAKRYHIPLDREHILGHDNVPGLSSTAQGNMHWDPAVYWDWNHFFELLGAPIHPKGPKKHRNVVTIKPNFNTNLPPVTYGGVVLEPQPANFVYLHTAPSFSAPYISDPTLHKDGASGTTNIYDWGDKAVTGQSFVKAGEVGNWTGIYYGGQIAWFYNPHGKNAVETHAMVVTPKKGLEAVPVYGGGYPEGAAFDKAGIPQATLTPLNYTFSAGQKYVATGPFKSDYYYAKVYNDPSAYKLVRGDDEFYQISFNHRIAFVKASDVTVIK
ncbi:N-acetylmuramoyl-L-alanine amidase [Tuberibacillus calidus]|uniref:N-acetylmuramoyl-L-alanine amidase n=1 Tax=Tuberibacillus calidus TaxID=340097 RepID=UPI00041BCC2B|nr:N-acetylmuramoyl-L-alanine amidase [Tuberibacillus calidus]